MDFGCSEQHKHKREGNIETHTCTRDRIHTASFYLSSVVEHRHMLLPLGDET